MYFVLCTSSVSACNNTACALYPVVRYKLYSDLQREGSGERVVPLHTSELGTFRKEKKKDSETTRQVGDDYNVYLYLAAKDGKGQETFGVCGAVMFQDRRPVSSLCTP